MNFIQSSSHVTLLLTVTVSVLFLKLLWSRRKLYYASWILPGPFSIPIIGSIFPILDCLRNTEEIMKIVMTIAKKYGSTYRVWVGPRMVIAIFAAEDLQVVYNNPACFNKDPVMFKGIEYFLGNSIILAPVKTWKGLRKLMNQSFNMSLLNSYLDNFVNYSNALVKDIRKNTGNGKFDIGPEIFKTTSRMLLGTNLGATPSTMEHSVGILLKYLEEAIDLSFQQSVRPWLYIDSIFKLTKIGKKAFKINEITDTMSCKICKDKRQELNEKKLNANNKNITEVLKDEKSYPIEEKENGQKHLINLLLEENEKGALTEKDLRDNINAFLAAGTDTTGNTVSFASMFLGSHPECQAEAYAEIKNIFGDSDRQITLEDVTQMKYIERVIKETMRFFPPNPMNTRYIEEDVKFSKITAPAGSVLLISAFCVQRDPQYWPNPLKFDPNRFLPEEISKTHPYAYIPFAAGPRNCIGQKQAMMSMKILLCTMLRHYEFKSDIDVKTIRIKGDAVLKNIDGYYVQINERKCN